MSHVQSTRRKHALLQSKWELSRVHRKPTLMWKKLRVFSLLLFIALGLTLLSALHHTSKQSSSIATSHHLRVSSSSLQSAATSITGTGTTTMQASKLSLKLPSIIYGTAWKKERTKELVELAVKTGFRAIDTACQPRHYHEPGVGDALQALYAEDVVRREDLFLQTKFTSVNGQDTRSIPYDPRAPLEEQVRQSFAKSLENLRTSYLDSYVMHSPMETMEDTLAVWRVFEEFHQRGLVRALGLSNCYDLSLLRTLFERAHVKPSFLQNRFYHKTGYDKEIREFCRENGIQYQSFWTLTANPHIISSPLVSQLAIKYNKTREQIFFRFVKALGILPLTGTTSPQHMQEDLAVDAFELDKNEVVQLMGMLY